MDVYGLFGALAFVTFVIVGGITFLIVSRTQVMKDGLSMVEKDYE